MATKMAAVLAAAVLSAGTAMAEPASGQTCEASNADAVGAYEACLAKADKAYVSTGDETKYSERVSECTVALAAALDELQAAAGSACAATEAATSLLDFADAYRQRVAGGAADAVYRPAARPLETGQTLCYDSAGGLIACVGSGQDGAFTKGVARSFTDNHDGTVTDRATGLMWEKLSDDGSIHDKDKQYTWTNAFAGKVAALNSSQFAGYEDWRVPNAFEIYSLANLGKAQMATYEAFGNGCKNGCTVTTCSCTKWDGRYWSSTTNRSDRQQAWHVGSGTGDVSASNKTYDYGLRAVRGGSPARMIKTGQTSCYNAGGGAIRCAGTGQDGELRNGVARSFTDNLDGTVTDQATGLTWEKLSDDGTIHDKDKTYTWARALSVKVKALNASRFAGYRDWRLPNAFEMYSLSNLGKTFPVVYAPFNTGCTAGCTVKTCSCTRSYNYWSSTTSEYYPASAWFVDSTYGFTGAEFKTASFTVRAVRGGL